MAQTSLELLTDLGKVPGNKDFVTASDIISLSYWLRTKADDPNFDLGRVTEQLTSLKEALGREQIETESNFASEKMNQAYNALSLFIDGIKLVRTVHRLRD